MNCLFIQPYTKWTLVIWAGNLVLAGDGKEGDPVIGQLDLSVFGVRER